MISRVGVADGEAWDKGVRILIDSWIVITAPMKSEMMKTIQKRADPETVHLSDDGAEEHPPGAGQREARPMSCVYSPTSARVLNSI